jgi:hypothetical protein
VETKLQSAQKSFKEKVDDEPQINQPFQALVSYLAEI